MNDEKYSCHDVHRDVLYVLVLAEFCMEVFDGGKCQRHYFSFISGIVAQFFEFKRAIGIFSQARGQNFVALKARVVAQGACMLNNIQPVTSESPKMSGKQIID